MFKWFLRNGVRIYNNNTIGFNINKQNIQRQNINVVTSCHLHSYGGLSSSFSTLKHRVYMRFLHTIVVFANVQLEYMTEFFYDWIVYHQTFYKRLSWFMQMHFGCVMFSRLLYKNNDFYFYFFFVAFGYRMHYPYLMLVTRHAQKMHFEWVMSKMYIFFFRMHL